MSLLIHAPNVHQGGGKVLLLSLLEALKDRAGVRALFLDQRLEIPDGLVEETRVIRVAPRLGSRIAAERQLQKEASEGDTIFCFGNLPPLFRSSAEIVVFVQNLYLVGKAKLRGLPLSTQVRIALERIWLAARRRSVDRFIVQTPSMKRVFEQHFDVSATLLPFSVLASEYSRGHQDGKQHARGIDFLYVASGEEHKNHRNLIDAWCLLAEENLRPSLYLTIDSQRFPRLCSFIEQRKRQHNLNIENNGAISAGAIQQTYSKCRALIYPSKMESLGLPLIEARCNGLSIVASELDFVRDAVDPEETFDPASAVSIARAVKRFLGVREAPLPLLEPDAFLAAALGTKGGAADF